MYYVYGTPDAKRVVHKDEVDPCSRMKLTPITTNFTLKDHVYERLKDAIAGVDIYDDAAELRLDERSLSEQLGVSRTPLREAIARLERDGLVEVVPRKGVYLQRKSMEEILEMIVAWAALESMAARLAAERASDADIAGLRMIAAKYNEGTLDTRISEYSDDNIRFHQHILEISGCALLKTMADGLFVHMQAVRLRAMNEGDRVRRSVVDHAEIIEALEARDAELASERVRAHTMRLHDHVRKTWTQLEAARAAKAANDG